MRDALIHLLAGVDGNESAEQAILDHLYGRQADALIAAGWRLRCEVCSWSAQAGRPSGSATLPVIAERIIEAPLTSACPTCGGLIGKYENVGLVDGEWVCAGCFTFDPSPREAANEVHRLFAEITLAYRPITADELVTATAIPRNRLVGELSQLCRMGWIIHAGYNGQDPLYVAADK